MLATERVIPARTHEVERPLDRRTHKLPYLRSSERSPGQKGAAIRTDSSSDIELQERLRNCSSVHPRSDDDTRAAGLSSPVPGGTGRTECCDQDGIGGGPPKPCKSLWEASKRRSSGQPPTPCARFEGLRGATTVRKAGEHTCSDVSELNETSSTRSAAQEERPRPSRRVRPQSGRCSSMTLESDGCMDDVKLVGAGRLATLRPEASTAVTADASPGRGGSENGMAGQACCCEGEPGVAGVPSPLLRLLPRDKEARAYPRRIAVSHHDDAHSAAEASAAGPWSSKRGVAAKREASRPPPGVPSAPTAAPRRKLNVRGFEQSKVIASWSIA